MKALSIKQPWAWAIMHAGKDIENRDWPTNFRGTVAIHASKGMTADDYDACYFFVRETEGLSTWRQLPPKENLERGVVLGTVDIVGCVGSSNSPWFVGDYGFVLKNPRLLPNPLPCKGALGFWHLPDEIEQVIIRDLIANPQTVSPALSDRGTENESELITDNQ